MQKQPWTLPENEKLTFKSRNPSALVTPIWIGPDGTVYVWSGGNVFILGGASARSVHITDYIQFHL